MSRSGDSGVPDEAVAWFLAHVPEVSGEPRFQRITGGRSNLTYRVTDDAGTTWEGYVAHDFVRALGAGTLPEAAFRHFLVQDYLFLIHFARAWSLAVAKAGSLPEMRACSAIMSALAPSNPCAKNISRALLRICEVRRSASSVVGLPIFLGRPFFSLSLNLVLLDRR